MEIDLCDRFDDRVLDASDKTYATSRKMEIINEIIPICSLTDDVQDQVLDEYERVKNAIYISDSRREPFKVFFEINTFVKLF